MEQFPQHPADRQAVAPGSLASSLLIHQQHINTVHQRQANGLRFTVSAHLGAWGDEPRGGHL
jgi:hypothetical protein